jgi:hypothetical protein
MWVLLDHLLVARHLYIQSPCSVFLGLILLFYDEPRQQQQSLGAPSPLSDQSIPTVSPSKGGPRRLTILLSTHSGCPIRRHPHHPIPLHHPSSGDCYRGILHNPMAQERHTLKGCYCASKGSSPYAGHIQLLGVFEQWYLWQREDVSWRHGGRCLGIAPQSWQCWQLHQSPLADNTGGHTAPGINK